MWTMSNLVGRICKKDCEIAPGLLIKKDMQVWTPIAASHQNEDFFPEPEKFKPERFINKDFDPITFRPFIAGPRMCIGNRFALTEMKIATAMTLKSFRYKFNFFVLLMVYICMFPLPGYWTAPS